MRKFLVLALVLALVAGAAMAGPTASDIRITASGGRSLSTGLGSPMKPMLFDVATDGTAYAKFMLFKNGCTDRADSTQIVLKIVVLLRDYTPPRAPYFPTGMDSVYVGLGTATEVIISR